MKRFLISCGGTGGHLAPGIALAQELVARGHQVTLLISEKRVDAQLAAKYPELNFRSIAGAPLALTPRGLGRFGVQQARGFWQAHRYVRRLRPSVIIGLGGFTTSAVIVTGSFLGVPIALHEANRVPGRAIRALAPLARRLYLPVGVTLSAGRNDRVRHAGLPVRREIRPEPRDEARRALGLDPAQRVVAVLGGSQGAKALNQWAEQEAAVLARARIQLVCVTGAGQGGPRRVEHPDLEGRPVVALSLPFCDRMATLLSAADLVVSRAGAGTIAELIRCHTPAVLVPYPHAADDHQAANAAHLAREEAAWVLPQHQLSNLTRTVLDLLSADERLLAVGAQLRRLDRDDVLGLLAEDLESLADRPLEGSVRAPSLPAA